MRRFTYGPRRDVMSARVPTQTILERVGCVVAIVTNVEDVVAEHLAYHGHAAHLYLPNQIN